MKDNFRFNICRYTVVKLIFSGEKNTQNLLSPVESESWIQLNELSWQVNWSLSLAQLSPSLFSQFFKRTKVGSGIKGMAMSAFHLLSSVFHFFLHSWYYFQNSISLLFSVSFPIFFLWLCPTVPIKQQLKNSCPIFLQFHFIYFTYIFLDAFRRFQ